MMSKEMKWYGVGGVRGMMGEVGGGRWEVGGKREEARILKYARWRHALRHLHFETEIVGSVPG